MLVKVQTLIIYILGAESILALIGLFALTLFSHSETTLLLALVPLVSTPVAILGGFLQGKKIIETESEPPSTSTQESMETQPVQTESEGDTDLEGA